MWYAWNMVTDEVKLFRFQHARDRFVQESGGEYGLDWTEIEASELYEELPE